MSFNASGGSDVASITAAYGTTITAPADPEKTGHTFSGWYREPECINAWDFSMDTIAGDGMLYAKWTINRYTLSYRGGAYGTVKGDPTQTVTYGGDGAKVTAVPKANCHFERWSDGVKTPGRTDTNVSRDISVTAMFTKDTFKVVFVDYDGTVLKEQYVPYGESATPPAYPERAGYEFTGWDKGFANITAGATITAQYRVKTYRVTFKDSDGKIIGTQSVEHGGDAEAPAVPDKHGQQFEEWDGEYNDIDKDTEVTAKYTAVPEVAILSQWGTGSQSHST